MKIKRHLVLSIRM